MLAVVTALSAGCTGIAPDPALHVEQLSSAVLLENVPFYPQAQYQCGPSALASALAASGTFINPDSLAPQVYLPERHGSLQSDLISATRRAGRVAYLVAPDLSSLIRFVAAGIPVVVLQNVGGMLRDQWHYAVVVGYDLRSRILHLRSGDQADLETDFTAFERSWSKGGHWAIAVLAPDHLPPEPDEAQWLRAAVPLERTDPQAAARAYRTALSHWPESLLARLGLGNLNYAAGRLSEAGSDYETAARQHPQSADAWNNLAQVLLEQGKLEAARHMAEHAVTLGGEHADDYRRTLEAIDAARAQRPVINALGQHAP